MHFIYCSVGKNTISRPNDCLSSSLIIRTSCVCTCPTDCPFKITPYKFVPRISLLLSSVNTPPMGPPVKAWNETRNSPDDDDPTSHSLSLTSSLDKTEGRFPPGVADESKTHSPVSHNTSLDNNNTNNFTSSDKKTPATIPPANRHSKK